MKRIRVEIPPQDHFADCLAGILPDGIGQQVHALLIGPHGWMIYAGLAIGALSLLFIVPRLLSMRRVRPCRWKRETGRNLGKSTRFTCLACKVDAFTQNGRPPIECKRHLKEANL